MSEQNSDHTRLPQQTVGIHMTPDQIAAIGRRNGPPRAALAELLRLTKRLATHQAGGTTMLPNE
jgi:hypothetical protein